MPEKTELQKIDKGIQRIVEEIKKQSNLNTAEARQKEIEKQWALEEQKWKEDQRKEDEQDRKEEKEVKKENLSTWGSIKAGINAFNVSLENDENNKITWGKIGGQLKESISAWYNQTLEMDNLLGKTFRLGAAIWENVNKHIISSLKTAFSGVTAGIREVLGPVAEAFDAVKNAVVGMFGFFKGMYVSIFGKVKPEDKVRNRLLQGIVNYFKDEKKKDAREMGGKKKLPKPLAMLLLGLGIVIGAIVGAIMAPFRLLLAVLKKIKPIGLAITKFFGEGSKFAGVLDKAKKWFEPIKALFGEGGKFAGLGKTFGKMGKFLKPLVAGFKIGFKVLGWPLTVLLGIIDFIRGFISEYGESGSIVEALKAGLKSAFMGLFEAPVYLIGLLGDWVLKQFGVEVKGGLASKIMDAISSIFDWIFKIPELITKTWEWVKSKSGFGQTEEEKIADRQKYFGGGDITETSKIKQVEEDKKAERERWRARMKKNEEEKLAKKETERIKKEIAAKKLLDETAKTNVNINQLNQTTESNNQQIEQIPDEIDSSLVGLELLWDF